MDSSSSNGQAQGEPQQATDGNGSITRFLMERKIASVMWIVRLYAVFLSIQYTFLWSPYDMAQTFQRVLIANAVVCALRLHQRIPNFRLSRDHLALIMQEDSAHYLLYSFIFMMCHPFTFALMPVAIFALLHTCSFTRQLLDVKGPATAAPVRRLLNFVAKHQVTLFRIVALNEVFIFAFTVGMVLSGRAPLFAPFLYYKFVQLRYVSKRNPYSRIVFYELRVSLEYFSQKPNCPRFVSNAIMKGISLVNRMAPRTVVNPPQQS